MAASGSEPNFIMLILSSPSWKCYELWAKKKEENKFNKPCFRYKYFGEKIISYY